MRKFIVGCAFAAMFASPAMAVAQSGSGQELVFQCTLRNGKMVRVTAQGGNVFYDYGRGARRELSLRGTARTGNVFFLRQRYASIQSQLRFVNGGYSYIVHSMGASVQAGSSAISGLVVMRGTRRIADHSCRAHAEIQGGFGTLEGLPEDSETYSVM
jgi:hypothetical protein